MDRITTPTVLQDIQLSPRPVTAEKYEAYKAPNRLLNWALVTRQGLRCFSQPHVSGLFGSRYYLKPAEAQRQLGDTSITTRREDGTPSLPLVCDTVLLPIYYRYLELTINHTLRKAKRMAWKEITTGMIEAACKHAFVHALISVTAFTPPTAFRDWYLTHYRKVYLDTYNGVRKPGYRREEVYEYMAMRVDCEFGDKGSKTKYLETPPSAELMEADWAMFKETQVVDRITTSPLPTRTFGVAIANRTVEHLKDAYGPSKPIPPEGRGGFTREQIEFVMASTEPHSHIAKAFNTRFSPPKPVSHRQIRHIQQFKEAFTGRKRPTPTFPLGYEASFRVSVPGAAPGADTFMVQPAQQEAPPPFPEGLPPSSFSHEAMPTGSGGQDPSAADQSPGSQPFPSTSAQHPNWAITLYTDLHYPDASDFGYTDYQEQDGYRADEIGGYPDEVGQQDEYGAEEIRGYSDDLSQQAENGMQQHDRASSNGQDGSGMSVIDDVVPFET
ncbi:hypothetical protein GE09DRAFT_1294759 [Coniochaeta sp. 2T2.1]|nr:hypothetical protein GE09DRAFT_1294759 [Coniochaeta sp. 2T2.1]